MNIFRLSGDLCHLLAIIVLLLKIWKTRSCAGLSGKSQIMFAMVYTSRYLDLFTSFISLYNSSMKVIFIFASFATIYLIYMKFKATYDSNHDTFRIEFLLVPVAALAFLINHDFTPLEDSTIRQKLNGQTDFYRDDSQSDGLKKLSLPEDFIPTQVVSHYPKMYKRQFFLGVLQCLSQLVAHFVLRFALQILWTFSIYLEAVAILPQLFMISKTGEAETITSHYLFALGMYRALYIVNWVYRYYYEGFFDIIAVVAGCVQTVLYCDFFYLYITKVWKGKKLTLPA
ncbi:hypothetical protein LSH36_339g00007 [Paralvinella palmiformis]|uniref:ER lumen protein-retaining receptor n=1 Tax=Paralvinella palmiformis TaxID=53620 RepID=A0AAD9JFB4_9ANNE|nr:hypothetical protein LSH36_339g00007 [Paralvinella palmiformis]